MKTSSIPQTRTVEITERLPVSTGHEVIVAGGGVAGAAAALAAARAGKRVLLIEKATLLGGLSTIGLVNWFVPMCNGRGRKIMSGMVDEFVRLATRDSYDTIPEGWRDGGATGNPEVRYTTLFSPQIFAYTLAEYLSSAGVELMFDTIVTRPLMNGKHCDGLIVENKSGRSILTAEIFIDTTGDADILRRSGMPVVIGRNYFTYTGMEITLESCRRAVEHGDIRFVYQVLAGGEATLYGDHHPENLKKFNATDAADVTEYLLLGQKRMLEKLRTTDRHTRDICTPATMMQSRTSCRIDGDYTLQEQDHCRHFPDSVGAICDFDRRDYLYEVPYRTLVRSGYDNLITAGRCASGNGYAWDVLRVIPPAILTGQAAGSAAALAIDQHSPLPELKVADLQTVLQENRVSLHFDDSLIPRDGGGGSNEGGEPI